MTTLPVRALLLGERIERGRRESDRPIAASPVVLSVGGGSAVQSGTPALWLEKTGCPICEGYGLSETSPSATWKRMPRAASP